ncbi:hypothetical protein [Acinetobacter pecorum]|uniref:CHAT domain-containing protein n=1 Tax=Acinetobacter pecorum TaxID=2762215 RepID=A0ABR8W0X1_9GAMM|nr:hypothetical protein [Acinetobacter pecorum]MBD8010659.1 hypothetical protein [Acinetobacter pecorum]
MLNPIQPFDFYVDKVKKTVSIYKQNELELILLRDPIYSFFSNKELSEEHFNSYNPIHFSDDSLVYFLCHTRFKDFFSKNNELFYNWIEACYYYWICHDPMKKLGSLVFNRIFYFFIPNTIAYHYQMMTLIRIINYSVEYKEDAILNKSEYILSHYHQFLDDNINWELPVLIVQELIFSRKENNKLYENIRKNNLKRLKTIYDEYFEDFHESTKINIILKLIFHDEYYEKSYTDLIECLKNDEILKNISAGNTEYLKNVFARVFSKSDYKRCMELFSIINGYRNTKIFSSQHGIVVPNNNIFSLLTNSEHINYLVEDQYAKYCKLIECENKALVLSTVLRDFDLQPMIENTGKDYGFPSKDFDFNEFLEKTISCYSLNHDLYQSINYLTITPSHSHPVQAALSYLDKVPPIISYSLNELKDFNPNKKFAFFLGENTLLPNYEYEFIEQFFSNENRIFENPSVEQIVEVFNDPSFTHIYISAHGNYEHSSCKLDSFEFSNENRISVDIFNNLQNRSEFQRVVVMNACSGAHSGINLNFLHKGISSKLLKNNFAVFSNLWPISSDYSVVLGMLLVYNLSQNDDLREVYFNTFSILKMKNCEISKKLIEMDEVYFKKIALKVFDENIPINNFTAINDFSNIGAMCMYN